MRHQANPAVCMMDRIHNNLSPYIIAQWKKLKYIILFISLSLNNIWHLVMRVAISVTVMEYMDLWLGELNVGHRCRRTFIFREKRCMALTFRCFAYSVLKFGWYPCLMHILERVRLLNRDRARLPSAGMSNGSLECHNLKGILQEGRLVSSVYVICKAKVSTAHWQYVVKGEIQRFLSQVLLGMWVEFSRLTPVNIIHISGLLLSFIKAPEKNIYIWLLKCYNYSSCF